MEKEETIMKVSLDKEALRHNVSVIKSQCDSVAFMVKSQILSKDLLEVLEGHKVYTTLPHPKALDIYSTDDIVIVDAFESREGVTMTEAKERKTKGTAILNTFCCSSLIPSVEDVNDAYDSVKAMGYKIVSMGGSMLLTYEGIKYDELRVGEIMLTGYSTVYNNQFLNCLNPYSVEVDVYKETEDTWVVRQGFLSFGGFTNVKPICVNTDFTVFAKNDLKEADGKLTLFPDYYSLIKLAYGRFI